MINFRCLNCQLDTLAVLRYLRLPGRCEGEDQWRGHCPRHEVSQRHARYLSVSISRRAWTCWRCRTHGDLIDLVSLTRNLSLVAAARELADLFGVVEGTGRGTVDCCARCRGVGSVMIDPRTLGIGAGGRALLGAGQTPQQQEDGSRQIRLVCPRCGGSGRGV